MNVSYIEGEFRLKPAYLSMISKYFKPRQFKDESVVALPGENIESGNDYYGTLFLRQEFHNGKRLRDAYYDFEETCNSGRLSLDENCMRLQAFTGGNFLEPFDLSVVSGGNRRYRDIEDYIVETEMIIPGLLGNFREDRPRVACVKPSKHVVCNCAFEVATRRNGLSKAEIPFTLFFNNFHLYSEERILDLFKELYDSRPLHIEGKPEIRINAFEPYKDNYFVNAFYSNKGSSVYEMLASRAFSSDT